MKLDEAYWDGRYKANATGWDLGEVSPPLRAYIDQLENPDLRILIPGGGNSYEAEYLFKNGFHKVYVVDISKTALDRFQQRVPDFPSVQVLHKNLFDLNMEFDLIIEQTFFCALDPKLRSQYVLKMNDLLKDQGTLVGLLFGVPLNTDQPPFGGTLEEYKGLFSNTFQIQTMAPCYNSIEPRQGRELFFKCIKQ